MFPKPLLFLAICVGILTEYGQGSFSNYVTLNESKRILLHSEEDLAEEFGNLKVTMETMQTTIETLQRQLQTMIDADQMKEARLKAVEFKSGSLLIVLFKVAGRHHWDTP